MHHHCDSYRSCGSSLQRALITINAPWEIVIARKTGSHVVNGDSYRHQGIHPVHCVFLTGSDPDFLKNLPPDLTIFQFLIILNWSDQFNP